jgi:hypothetical protein
LLKIKNNEAICFGTPPSWVVLEGNCIFKTAQPKAKFNTAVENNIVEIQEEIFGMSCFHVAKQKQKISGIEKK